MAHDRDDEAFNRVDQPQEPQSTKTIIFSYFTKALDLLSSQLDIAGERVPACSKACYLSSYFASKIVAI